MSRATQAAEEIQQMRKKIQHFKIDDLEQYTRKDNVRVHGLPEIENEDTIEEVVKLGRKAGIEITKNDVSTAHRLPGNCSNGKPSTVIVKFVRRDTKTALMRKKKNL